MKAYLNSFRGAALLPPIPAFAEILRVRAVPGLIESAGDSQTGRSS